MVPTTPDQTINASNFVKTIISLGVCACVLCAYVFESACVGSGA